MSWASLPMICTGQGRRGHLKCCPEHLFPQMYWTGKRTTLKMLSWPFLPYYLYWTGKRTFNMPSWASLPSICTGQGRGHFKCCTDLFFSLICTGHGRGHLKCCTDLFFPLICTGQGRGHLKCCPDLLFFFSFFLLYFLQLYCPNGIFTMGNLGCLPWGKPAATVALPNLRCMLGVLVFP